MPIIKTAAVEETANTINATEPVGGTIKANNTLITAAARNSPNVSGKDIST